MKPITVAYLGLLDNDRATGTRRAEEHLMRLAQAAVAAADFGLTVELISAGETPGRQTVSAGVVRTVLPLAGKPQAPWNAVSWQLPEALERADLVHLHDGYSRLGEAALLIAKQSRLPVCITEYGLTGHWLSSELGLAELADVVICHASQVARRLTTSRSVEVVPCKLDLSRLGIPGVPPRQTDHDPNDSV
ncbi:MAG TPA: glycosyltransferase, partial [Pirellulales bacterium]|nr:glycosyltransferase [Pirellulales bacterium]